MPNHTPKDCASQSTQVKLYIENGHRKIRFEPDHDTHQCPICLLCVRHCLGHYQLLDGLRPLVEPQSYRTIKAQIEAQIDLARQHQAEIAAELQAAIEPIIRKRKKTETQLAV